AEITVRFNNLFSVRRTFSQITWSPYPLKPTAWWITLSSYRYHVLSAHSAPSLLLTANCCILTTCLSDNLLHTPIYGQIFLYPTQTFLKSSTCPEIHGYLHAKEQSKKSWKKFYFVLRRSGLYYSNKGTSKEPRHLQFFTDFSDSHVYTVLSAKKLHGAPTEFGFCVKVPSFSFKYTNINGYHTTEKCQNCTEAPEVEY
uniref:PH domain-containing protein n=1 Tax=Amphiprion percula TaxID=161767 RepID=A0A3P8TL75_AMPPE